MTLFPWEDIPDIDALPDMDAVCEVAATLKMSSTQKLMVEAQLKVQEPKDFYGMMHTENYVLGTDERPGDVVQGSFGARNMKKLLKAAQVPKGDTVEQLVASLSGAIVGISFMYYKEEKGDYAGSDRNRITGYWKAGERTPQLTPKKGAAGAVVTQPAPTAPGPAVVPPPAAVAPQTAAPAVTPPPAVTTGAPANLPPPPAAAQPAPGGVNIPCPGCGAVVPSTEFAAHAQTCQGVQAAQEK